MQPVFDLVNDDADLDQGDFASDEESASAPHDNPILSIYRPDQEIDARKHLERFFAGKKLPNGRSVPTSMTHTDENFTLLLEGEFVDRVDEIYKELGTFEHGDPDQGGLVSEDVRFVLETLKDCASLKIPKNLAPGIVLIYVRICQTYRGLRIAN